MTNGGDMHYGRRRSFDYPTPRLSDYLRTRRKRLEVLDVIEARGSAIITGWMYMSFVSFIACQLVEDVNWGVLIALSAITMSLSEINPRISRHTPFTGSLAYRRSSSSTIEPLAYRVMRPLRVPDLADELDAST